MFKRNLFAPILAASFLLGSMLSPVDSQAVLQPREHDGGIFLRLSLGGGVAEYDGNTDLGEKLEFKDSGGNHNIAFGGMPWNNIALHATTFGWGISDPDYDVDGVDQGRLNGTASLTALGGGATWYIMPVNIYITGSIGFAWLDLSDQNITRNSATGSAFDLSVGKEWWVSDRWGLGVALGVQGYSVPLSRGDDEATGASVGLRFSATFN